MTRGIFIVGNESALSRAIEAETVNRVEQFAAALIPNRLSGAARNSAQENDKRLSLDWNPSSPISARTLVLAAENRLEHIDEAILVCSPPSIRGSAAELPLSDIEIMINDHIKGWFFLVKELSAVFSARRRGTLALVYPDISPSAGKDDAADILGPSALASFRALTNGLLSAAHIEPYITIGFSVSDAGNESAFAAFLYKTIDEITNRSNGKLHKFGKFAFFK
jgi:NAD(P)-dependent dehydrogenase (short-subunit alcohol dehydrogenase family)